MILILIKSIYEKTKNKFGGLILTDFKIHYAAAAAAKSLQSCPTLCDPIDGRPPGSPVPGILQARTQNRNRCTDLENKLMIAVGKGRGRDNYRVWDGHVHTTIF